MRTNARELIRIVALCAIYCGLSNAQTVTTSGGSVNTVPKFSGSNSLANSAISESDGKVGIGFTNPSAPLDVAGYLHVSGEVNPITNEQGSYFGRNALTGGTGETDFINNQGGGIGGFAFMNTGSSGSSGSTLMFLDGTGKLGINGSIGLGTFGYVSAYRGPANDYTNLFLGGGIVDSGNGTYTVKSDGGSNYFAAIRMDNAGGNAGAINFYGGPTISGSDYTLSNAQLATYKQMSLVGGRLEITGNLRLSAGSGASITFPDGTVRSTAWTGTLGGGDYAESIDVTGPRSEYEPGDVIVIDPTKSGNFSKSSKPYSRLVAGIYSTKPGMVGRRQTSDPKTSTSEIPMAMVGIVPTKVTAKNGPIEVGDLLVTSSLPGHAMKGTDEFIKTGSVIGKALGELSSGGRYR